LPRNQRGFLTGKKIMNKIYAIACSAAVVIAAFWAGGRIEAQRCRAEFATQQNLANVRTQSEIIKTKAKINEETYNTGAADIRDRLRAKYTIRE
jgi:hypothetical protein